MNENHASLVNQDVQASRDSLAYQSSELSPNSLNDSWPNRERYEKQLQNAQNSIKSKGFYKLDLTLTNYFWT